MKRLYHQLMQRQHLILGAAVFLLLSAVSVKISATSTELIWKEYPGIAILSLTSGLMLVMVYIQLDKYRLAHLNKQIQLLSGADRPELPLDVRQLTNRQRDIYDLILQGKSNKEIMCTLYIEASTLKTHVNQIYKKLKIKNRRQLRNRGADQN